jgi:hypothetical protein
MNSTIVATYLPGKNNLLADRLSRVTLDDHVRTNIMVILEIEDSYETITIDRFATNFNKICTTYNSYYLEEGASGIDAFAQTDYMQHVNYVFPPVSIVGRTLQFLK